MHGKWNLERLSDLPQNVIFYVEYLYLNIFKKWDYTLQNIL